MSNDLTVQKNVMSAQNTTEILELAKERFNAIACTGFDFDKEMHFVTQVLEKNSFLASIAFKKKQSLYNAMVNIASLGLTLNPASSLCYLVPRQGDVCLDVSYMGLIEILLETKVVRTISSTCVRANDKFKMGDVGKQCEHEFDPFLSKKERGEIKGVYTVALLNNGAYSYSVMSMEDVFKSRDRSEAYKAFKSGKIKSTPWVTDEEEMIKKTGVRRLFKTLPKNNNSRIAAAIEMIDKDVDLSSGASIESDAINKDDLLSDLGELLSKIDNGSDRLDKWLKVAHKIEVDEYDELSIEILQKALSTMKRAI